jgi:hypothetical protein
LAAIGELCRLDGVPDLVPHTKTLERIFAERQLQTA